MNRRKKYTSLFLKNMNIFFLIALFLFKYINCDCDESCSTDSTNCRDALFHEDCKCKINPSNTNKYFYVDASSSRKECRTISQCPAGKDKVVFDSNECVPNCGGTFELGDFCFKSPNIPYSYDDGTTNDFIEKITSSKYKCKDYTYVQLIDGKEYHICLKDPSTNPTEKCPSLYYDINEKKCVDSCNNKKIIKKTSPFNYFECRNECEYIEDGGVIKSFEYDESQDIESSNNVYCLPECPSTAPFYYKISNTIPPKCLKKCEQSHFYDEDTKQCLLECEDNNKLYLKEDSKDFFQCFTKSTDGNGCKNSHPYKYINACLKSCRDTQLTILFNKITYTPKPSDALIDNTCVTECDSFIDLDSFSCVDECPLNKMFHYNKKCLQSCSDVNLYYYINIKNPPSPYKKYECVIECPQNFYIYNEIYQEIQIILYQEKATLE